MCFLDGIGGVETNAAGHNWGRLKKLLGNECLDGLAHSHASAFVNWLSPTC